MNLFAKIIIGALMLVLGVACFAIVFGLLLGFPVMWLWNACLVGLVTGIGPITSFWQAFGLMVLCGLLFKSSSTSKS
jgi:hypothetical protein